MTTAVGDVTQATVDDEEKEEAEEEEEEDDDDEAEEEVMVPVADMLNAAYERDNVSSLLPINDFNVDQD
jgi:hypothetical protein